MQQPDKNKFHIAIVGSQASIHVVRWANALVEKGHRITVITMHSSKQAFRPDVEVIELSFKKPLGYILNIPKVKRILKALNPDIVHSFYALGYGFLARHGGHRPILLSVMGSDVYEDIEHSLVLKRIVRKNIMGADVVCSTSNIMAAQIQRLVSSSVEIEITPFGVDTNLFHPNDNIPKLDTYDYVLGTAKAMEPKYGIDILIKAFSDFCKKYPQKKFKLILAGDGVETSKLKKLAKGLKIEKNCVFLGNVAYEDVPDLLRKFNVFVALSRFDSESFGVAVVEALSCELPVIVSNAGGLKEVVENGVSGIIVSKNDTSEATKAMIALFEDSDLSKTLAKNGRLKVKREYEWKDSVDKMERLYGKLLARR